MSASCTSGCGCTPEHLQAPGDASRGDASSRSRNASTPSTLAINGGHDEAISHLRLVRDEDPDNDHALYMLAVAACAARSTPEAIAISERAIALNPENRALARRDADLEPLRQDESFRQRWTPRRRPPPLGPRRSTGAGLFRPFGARDNQRDVRHPVHVVILAAGKGTRMKSSACRRSCTAWAAADDRTRSFDRRGLIAVHDHGRGARPAEVRVRALSRQSGLSFVVQEPQLGTGHALW